MTGEITKEKLITLGFKKMKPGYYAATCDIIGGGFEMKIGDHSFISVWTSNHKEFYETNSYQDNKRINNMVELHEFIRKQFDLILLDRYGRIN